MTFKKRVDKLWFPLYTERHKQHCTRVDLSKTLTEMWNVRELCTKRIKSFSSDWVRCTTMHISWYVNKCAVLLSKWFANYTFGCLSLQSIWASICCTMHKNKKNSSSLCWNQSNLQLSKFYDGKPNCMHFNVSQNWWRAHQTSKTWNISSEKSWK